MSTGLTDRDDEREFLLRSIRDLDAEWAAGDIDEADYRSLRDEYTARAAAVLRGQPDPVADADSELTEGPPDRGRGRMFLAVAGSLVVAALAAVLIAGNVGQRSSGAPITGSQLPVVGSAGAGRDPRLDQAQTLFTQGKVLDAVKKYDAVLKDNPKNAEALAYRGWMLRLAGLSDLGLQSENAAEAADATYPDAHFFRGVILFEDKGDAAGAVKELRYFLSDNPPVNAIPRAEQELQKALQAAGPAVATTVDPRTNPAISPNFGPTTTAAPPAGSPAP